jgi:hypothetical protein
MKKNLLIAIILMSSVLVFAQPKGGRNGDGIEKIKIGVITNALNLSSEQAIDFWPIYNRYSQDQKTIRQARKGAMQTANAENASEADVQKAMKEIMDSKQQELDLQKRYQPTFLKVISAKQLMDLYITEKKFNEELMRRLKERKEVRNNSGNRKFNGMNRPRQRGPYPPINN